MTGGCESRHLDTDPEIRTSADRRPTPGIACRRRSRSSCGVISSVMWPSHAVMSAVNWSVCVRIDEAEKRDGR